MMETLNPSVVRLSGVLLISGAVTFWSIILAAIVYQMRTGSLPFKDWASVPARDFYESIAVHPGWWRWVNRCFALGIVWYLVFRPYFAAGVSLTLGDLPPFMLVPGALLVPAIAFGWLGLR